MNHRQSNSFCELYILFLMCSYAFGEMVKIKSNASHDNDAEENIAVQVMDNYSQQLVTRATNVLIVRRRSTVYRPAIKKYPKGAVYSKYKAPRFYITYKCPPRFGLFLCRKSCEKRSSNVIGSCDNGYCICLLLTPGFRGRGVFARRAKCSLQSQRVKCNKYCRYMFGSSTYGACRGRICRCFTNPVAPPGNNRPSACAEAQRKLKILEARLKTLLKKSPSARTPADKRLLQKITTPAKYKDLDSPSPKSSSSKRKSLSEKVPKSPSGSSRYSKPSTKQKSAKSTGKKKPVVSYEKDEENDDEDAEEYVSPSMKRIIAEKEKQAKKSSSKSPKKDLPSKTPLPSPGKRVSNDDDDDDDNDDDRDTYGEAIQTGIVSPDDSELDTPLVTLKPGPKKEPEVIDDYAAMLKENEGRKKPLAGELESQWSLEQQKKQQEEQDQQLKDYGQTPDPRKTQPGAGLKEEGPCPLTDKQQEELLDDDPEIVDTWYEDHSIQLPPIRTTQSERASQKATDQILQDPEYEGFLTNLDHEYRYGEDPPRDKLKPNSLLADIYQL